jgi:hypothetical protein
MVSQNSFCCCLIKGDKNQKKTKQNKTTENEKKTPQSVPSSNAVVSVSFLHAGVVRLLSHQRKKEKRICRPFCE